MTDPPSRARGCVNFLDRLRVDPAARLAALTAVEEYAAQDPPVLEYRPYSSGNIHHPAPSP